MRILVVDDEKLTRLAVKASLENPVLRGASSVPNEVTLASSVQEAVQCLAQHRFDIAFIDIRLGPRPHGNAGGIEILESVRTEHPTLVPIMMTSVEDHTTIERCLRMGAADYIFKPFDHDAVHLIMLKAQAFHRLFRQQQTLRIQAGKRAASAVRLKTRSASFQRVLDQAERLAHTSLSVLIVGETGVGKELLARHIWSLENDDSRPMVTLDSSTIPEDLVESTLFGHTKGAFTGATQSHLGCIQAAHGGDLFLDELANMSLSVQQKLLRALQEHKVRPVGANHELEVDFRLIAATNADLEKMVRRGEFREDLYFRIKRSVLRIPPLRERREDIPDLIELFLNRYGLGRKQLAPDALAFALEYSWPGNVRELEGVIETLAQTISGDTISREDLAAQVGVSPLPHSTPAGSATLASDAAQAQAFGLDERTIERSFKRLQTEFEQTMVRLALRKTGSENKAAQYLGIPRSTLVSKRLSWGWKDPAER